MIARESTWSRRRFGHRCLVAGGFVGLSSAPSSFGQDVRKRSAPSRLKITDLRVATLKASPFKSTIVRIDTNQGISGLGEVRDGASKHYALFLKSRILGENPCDVDRLFRRIKQFGGHGRQGGGVSAVEMALWDLAGKAYGVPVYQLIGGKFRERVRLYADTPEPDAAEQRLFKPDGVPDGRVVGDRLKTRMDMGFTWLKVDVGIGLLKNIRGALNSPSGAADTNSWSPIRITDKGIGILSDYIAEIRSRLGAEVPLAIDHLGPLEINSCIRLAKALTPHNLSWMEDVVPWQMTRQLRELCRSVDVPILTGEDIYLKEPFGKLLRNSAVDLVQPDLATAGGILETKKIADLAAESGIPTVLHCAGTPVHFLAAVHCAAALENFLCLEHHAIDVPWWQSLVTGLPESFIKNGFATVPDTPGLGIELNEDVARKHLDEPGYFEPTPEWNDVRSWDRTWS